MVAVFRAVGRREARETGARFYSAHAVTRRHADMLKCRHRARLARLVVFITSSMTTKSRERQQQVKSEIEISKIIGKRKTKSRQKVCFCFFPISPGIEIKKYAVIKDHNE